MVDADAVPSPPWLMWPFWRTSYQGARRSRVAFGLLEKQGVRTAARDEGRRGGYHSGTAGPLDVTLW